EAVDSATIHMSDVPLHGVEAKLYVALFAVREATARIRRVVDDKIVLNDGSAKLAAAAAVLAINCAADTGRVTRGNNAMTNSGVRVCDVDTGATFAREAMGDRHVLKSCSVRLQRVEGEAAGDILAVDDGHIPAPARSDQQSFPIVCNVAI